MKKCVVLLVALMMVAGVQAKEKKHKGASDGSVTKAAFIASEKQKAEASGKTFDESATEAAFAAKDKNGDGVLTADEMASAGKHTKNKKTK